MATQKTKRNESSKSAPSKEAPLSLDDALRRILSAPPQHKTAPKKEAAKPKRK